MSLLWLGKWFVVGLLIVVWFGLAVYTSRCGGRDFALGLVATLCAQFVCLFVTARFFDA